MRKRRKEHKFAKFMGKFIPYTATFLVILGIATVGSEGKNASLGDMDLNAASAETYNISADQLSELYVVASLSNSFDLASIDAVASNYVVASAMKEISQTGMDKIEKPSLISTSLSPGVLTHIVDEGETMEMIAWKYGITNDQIRWSNGLKTTDVTPGQVLKIPAVSGVVYTVRAGEALDAIAGRYGASIENIVASNELDASGVSEGMQIVLPGGTPPATERPEYVAPQTNSYSSNYAYTYSGYASSRDNLVVVARGAYNGIYTDINGSISQNPMTRGQCTWYAWYWRAANGNKLPGGGTLGNARTWAARAAAAGYAVDKNPRPGDVFQTTAGYYGHVGIVLSVNADGSLFVREMNIDSRGAGTLTEGTIPANMVGTFNYIH